jgi:hypothetical protein
MGPYGVVRKCELAVALLRCVNGDPWLGERQARGESPVAIRAGSCPRRNLGSFNRSGPELMRRTSVMYECGAGERRRQCAASHFIVMGELSTRRVRERTPVGTARRFGDLDASVHQPSG